MAAMLFVWFAGVSSSIQFFPVMMGTVMCLGLAMAGAYVGQKVLIESDASQKVYSIINKKLDSYLNQETAEKAEKAVRNTADKVEEMAVEAAKEKAKEVLNSKEDKKE